MAQCGERPLREVDEDELGESVAGDLAQRQRHEPAQQPARRERPAAKRGIDQGNDGGAAGATREPGGDRYYSQPPRAAADEVQETHALGPVRDSEACARSRHLVSCTATNRTYGCSVSINAIS